MLRSVEAPRVSWDLGGFFARPSLDPNSGITNVNYNFAELLARGGEPS